MKNNPLLLTCIYLLMGVYAHGETIPAIKIIDSLRSDNPKIVDATIKSLGIEKGVSGGFKKCQVVQPWVGRSNNSFVLALSWDPPDGYIIYLDSSGRIVSKVRSGYIKGIGLHEKDQLRVVDLIIVDGRVGYGSGFIEDRFQIFAIDKEGLNKIWEGISYLEDIYMQGKTVDGIIGFEPSSNNTYDLKYDYKVKRYDYNKDTKEFVVEQIETFSNTYTMENDKFILKAR
jgi:hypothetical protein